MLTRCRIALATAIVILVAASGTLPAGGRDDKDDKDKLKKPAETPTELPRIPAPDPKACELPPGFAARVVTTGLTYPTSIEFDDKGAMYIAEAGEAPGDEAAPARVLRITQLAGGATQTDVVADQLSSPVNDILWHQGKLYVSHRGKISVVEGPMKVRDLVTGLPSLGDHHNNQMAVGPDGKIYFGQGTATNSGVVGLDNYLLGWLHKHPSVCDVPAKDIALADDATSFESPDLIAVFTKGEPGKVKTGAFRPFGKTGDGAKVAGTVKANGTILRMGADGSNLEVYAWGLRNPYGVRWGPDKKLYVGDAGYDERGVRPVANSPDCLWVVKEGAWYGWPDYSAGIPVTDERYKPKDGPAPKFLMREHPPVEKPLLTLPAHTSATKFDFSPGGPFGASAAYAALLGDLAPLTGSVPADFLSYAVARIDTSTLKVEPFFRAKKDALGPKGFEYVATAGPRRPIAVRFAPRGDALFVVDFGPIAMVPSAIGGLPKPFPGTGTVWVITPAGPR